MDAERDARVPKGGRSVVAGVWAAAGVAHLCVVLFGVDPGPVGTMLAVAFTAVGVPGAVVLFVAPRPPVLLVAAAVGAVGVASFLLPRLVALPGLGHLVGNLTDPWAFGALLLDGLLVRLAVFTLRRSSRTAAQRPR